MHKYIVVCGQELDNHSLIDHPNLIASIEYDMKFFPEANGGCNFIESMVEKTVKLERKTVFLTRYGFILNKIGCMIGENKVDPKDVIVHLLDKCEWSEYTFDAYGVMCNDWPFGVLGY